MTFTTTSVPPNTCGYSKSKAWHTDRRTKSSLSGALLGWQHNKHSGSIPRNACVACETELCVTTKKVWLPKCDYWTDRGTDRQMPDKVIPMCRYASQAKQKSLLNNLRQSIISISITALFSHIPDIGGMYVARFLVLPMTECLGQPSIPTTVGSSSPQKLPEIFFKYLLHCI